MFRQIKKRQALPIAIVVKLGAMLIDESGRCHRAYRLTDNTQAIQRIASARSVIELLKFDDVAIRVSDEKSIDPEPF